MPQRSDGGKRLVTVLGAERDVFVGAGGKLVSVLGKFAPRLTDQYMEASMIDQQQSDKPKDGNSSDGWYVSKDSTLRERGDYEGHVSESSLYTKASLHPVLTGAAVALGAAGLAYTVYAKRNARSH